MLLNFGLGFLIKFVIIVVSASVFYKKQHKIAESLVCGWLVTYVGMIALLLILSCFRTMNRTGILGGGALALVIILLFYRHGSKQHPNTFFVTCVVSFIKRIL